MKRRYIQDDCPKRPIKAVIFGDGARSRAIWGRILKEINRNGSVNAVMVRDNPAGENERADNRYRIVIKTENGEKKADIDCIKYNIDGYSDFDALSSLADNGETDTVLWSPAENSWTLKNGKLKNEQYNPLAQFTMLLFRRFCLEMHGFTVISATEEEFNGDRLKQDIIGYASLRGLGMDFINWLNFENRFVNTVVQNLPQGTKRDEQGLCVYAEGYMLFVCDRKTEFAASCKNVQVTDSIEEYYALKKYVYDGALAVSCAYAVLHGVETLSGFMARQKLAKHTSVSVFEEIIPSLHVNFERVQIYAMETFDRFSNASCVLKWSSISENLAEKFAQSVVPIILEYIKINEKTPKHLVFALFCTVEYYRSVAGGDDYSHLFGDRSTEEILSDKRIWGEDLSFLTEEITSYEERMQ